MADVAGLLASAIVSQVGAKLGSAIGDQVSMICCFEDDMEDMKETLESMEAALEDAEKRSIKEKEVRLWLKRLKNAALDISDIMDERHTNSDQTNGKVLDMKRVGNTIISQVLKEGRHDGDNMEFINRRIRELLDDKNTLVILDDLWETDNSQLSKLKLMLNFSKKMKVLVTQRRHSKQNLHHYTMEA